MSKVIYFPDRRISSGVQPDGDVVGQRADGQFFNTVQDLLAGESYVSDWFDTDGFGTLELFFTADVPSANKGIVIEFTNDSNISSPVVRARQYFEFKESDVRIGYKVIHIRPVLDGFRVSYINGDENQSDVYIAANGRVNPEVGFENSGGAIVVGQFEREVSLGKVSNYGQNKKFGRNPDVDTGQPADIWGGGRNALGLYEYKGFNATANENLETLSSSANDVGTLVSSGTVTTTSGTALIDSGATFIADGVAVGDIILNDSRGIYGYITSVVSETELSVRRMIDTQIGQYDNIAGNSYRVATSASTGAAVVTWRRILNKDLERQTNVFVILNGVSGVITSIDGYRCSRGKVLLAGGTGSNEGELTCRQATTTANIFCVMPIGANKTLICADTVPKDTVYLLETVVSTMSISGGVSASGVVSLRVREEGGVFSTERIYDLSSTGGPNIDKEIGGIPLFEGTDFKLSVDSTSSNNARFSGNIEYLEIDEV